MSWQQDLENCQNSMVAAHTVYVLSAMQVVLCALCVCMGE